MIIKAKHPDTAAPKTNHFTTNIAIPNHVQLHEEEWHNLNHAMTFTAMEFVFMSLKQTSVVIHTTTTCVATVVKGEGTDTTCMDECGMSWTRSEKYLY